MVFDPQEHLSNIKGKDYLEVKWRLVWVNKDEDVTGLEIVTDELSYEPDVLLGTRRKKVTNQATKKDEWIDEEVRGRAHFSAHVKITYKNGSVKVGTGHKTETALGFDDYYEKAETGSIGRALALLGYGTQFAPELEEGSERLVDSPVHVPSSKSPSPFSSAQKSSLLPSGNSIPMTAGGLPRPPATSSSSSPVKTPATPAKTTSTTAAAGASTPAVAPTPPPAPATRAESEPDPSPSAVVKLTPRVEKVRNVTPQNVEEHLSATQAEFGPFGWKALMTKCKMKTSPTEWNFAEKVLVINFAAKWLDEGFYDDWKAQSLTTEQEEYLLQVLQPKYGRTRFQKILWELIIATKGKKFKNYTRGEADSAIAILLDEETVAILEEDAIKAEQQKQQQAKESSEPNTVAA